MREDEQNDALTQQIYQAIRKSFPPFRQPKFTWGCAKNRGVITFRTIRAYVHGDSVGQYDGNALLASIPHDPKTPPQVSDKETIIKGELFELHLLCDPKKDT